MALTLSREVLKWIQSLDLAYSVKNAKRDFSNGFLVAEIFSRYYDKDIQMHSFDNGNSTRVKRDNWAQLMKFFRKRGVMPGGELVSERTVEAIIHCRTGAVIDFLNQVYEFLSGRKVQEPPPPPKSDYVPAFAKRTATTVLRDSMRDPDFHITDLSRAEQKMRETLEGHEKELQAERLQDPSRFSTGGPRAPSKILRGPTRTVGAEERKQTVTVKKVNVKQVDVNVAQLRATKEMQATNSRQLASNSIVSSGTGGVGSGGGGYDPAPRNTISAIDVLNKAVMSVLSGNESVVESLDARKPAVVAFTDLVLSNPDLPEDLVTRALREAATQSETLADACLGNPREFWKVVSVYQPLVSKLPVEAPAFQTATEAFCSLGDVLVSKDAATASALFADFAMRPLCDVIKANPRKRQGVLSIMYAFATQSWEDHANVIRLLQETLDDLPTFISSLTHLIYLETEFDPDLLDIYHYYCRIGMGLSSPSLRAASLGMLAVLAENSPDAVARDVTRLAALRSDPWWEVQAQVAVVCSVLMSVLGSEDATAHAATRVCSTMLAAGPPPAAARVAIAHIAKNVATFPELAGPLVSALLNLPAGARQSLLRLDSAGAEKVPVVRGAALAYSLSPLPTQWNGAQIGKALADLVVAQGLEHLDAEHFEVLSAALHSGDVAGDTTWLGTFEALKNFIYVAVCDGGISELALQILRVFCLESSLGPAVLTDPMLVAAMRLMHSPDQDNAATHQAALADFLSEVAGASSAHRDAVARALSEFKASNPDEFASSPLQSVAV